MNKYLEPQLIRRAQGYEFWLHFDESAQVYELLLDSEGETYIGEFDTVAEAKAYIPAYLADQI